MHIKKLAGQKSKPSPHDARFFHHTLTPGPNIHPQPPCTWNVPGFLPHPWVVFALPDSAPTDGALHAVQAPQLGQLAAPSLQLVDARLQVVR